MLKINLLGKSKYSKQKPPQTATPQSSGAASGGAPTQEIFDIPRAREELDTHIAKLHELITTSKILGPNEKTEFDNTLEEIFRKQEYIIRAYRQQVNGFIEIGYQESTRANRNKNIGIATTIGAGLLAGLLGLFGGNYLAIERTKPVIVQQSKDIHQLTKQLTDSEQQISSLKSQLAAPKPQQPIVQYVETIHKVREGDDLWKIVNSYMFEGRSLMGTVKKVLETNGLSIDSKLKEGRFMYQFQMVLTKMLN